LNADANYSLVWEDKFENVGPIKAIIDDAPAYAPNPKNWAYEIGTSFGGLQNYTDSIYNCYVQNNQLTIVAMKEGYTSARLNSRYLQGFTYGIFAAKIRLPYGQGIWPAFWLLGNGTSQHQVWSPTAGEIDILEMVGGHTAEGKGDRIAYATIHWNNASNTMNPVHHLAKGSQWITPDGSILHNNSYTYWTLWNTTNIIIGIDNITYFTFNTTNIPDSINPVYAWTGYWPFYMILNIAIGGIWPGPPDNTTIWPQKMIVDWVRVYQLSSID
jgi:beta-glucanase (GH16 family)